jgi:hypothetical protein
VAGVLKAAMQFEGAWEKYPVIRYAPNENGLTREMHCPVTEMLNQWRLRRIERLSCEH